MAAQGSRTLKLSLLADVAEFSKNIKGASKDTETIGDQFSAFGQKAAVALRLLVRQLAHLLLHRLKRQLKMK